METSPATSADLDQLVELESLLFVEDAGVHDPYTNIEWPGRHAAADFERLLADDAALVLVARDGPTLIGMLVGYTVTSGSTRAPVTVAVLRDLIVRGMHRGNGHGSALVAAFVQWARDLGCAEASVDHFAANLGAGRFYERHGFAPRSLNRVSML